MSVAQVNSGTAVEKYDAIIIGAGISGMYQLYRLREMGMSVRVLEMGTDVGGTWYWNRYPGARFDSESYSYGYSFSQDILDEWDWSEHFAAQPEILRYLQFVADKIDVRKDIDFSTRVKAAIYLEDDNLWQVETDDGRRLQGKFLITAVGPLSAPQMPNIDGVDDFEGEAYHTGLWPHQPVEMKGKRVGIIGTGATAVQVIQTIASEVDHLTIFQRTPNWCAPLGNSAISKEEMEDIRARYPEIFQQCKESFGSFMHAMDRRSVFDLSPEERNKFWEELYDTPGFAMWLGNFYDILTDEKANAEVSKFVENKIRERINDPAIADKLIPKNHGFGTRRVPMETNYYEVYNRDNVTLIDCRDTPIERITPKGIKTSEQEFEFDMIIYATGFNAVVGALERIEITGVGGKKLNEKWKDGPRTFLGMQTAGFPNMFTLVGPHNGSTFCNIPRCIEQNVEWVTELIRYMHEHDYEHCETTVDAENDWTQHVYDAAMRTLFPTADSWFMNVNQNMPEKQRTFLLYSGGSPVYRQKCDDVAAKDYAGFEMH
ncbi:MAG: flavin-containing monooxygenase [Gammaproteobacteria bacterium]